MKKLRRQPLREAVRCLNIARSSALLQPNTHTHTLSLFIEGVVLQKWICVEGRTPRRFMLVFITTHSTIPLIITPSSTQLSIAGFMIARFIEHIDMYMCIYISIYGYIYIYKYIHIYLYIDRIIDIYTYSFSSVDFPYIFFVFCRYILCISPKISAKSSCVASAECFHERPAQKPWKCREACDQVHIRMDTIGPRRP